MAVIQSFMGRPKIHKPKDPVAVVDHLFSDVVITIFELMCRYESFWKEVKWSRPTAVFGFGMGDLEVPPPVEADINVLSTKFGEGLSQHWDLYKAVLDGQNINKVEEVASLPSECFEFPTGLWAKVLYDFAIAYKTQAVPRDVLVGGLTALYCGKTFSFVLETQAMDAQQVEEFIEDQCVQFEKTKSYLLERWFSV